MIKLCVKCKLLKEHKIRNDRGGKPQHHCIDCQRAYRKTHYEANKQKYLDKAHFWRKDRIKEIQRLKETPCQDCGIQYPYYVMQFDHVEDKEFGMAAAFGVSKERALAEAAKCDVVCANCHAERTHRRRSSGIGVSGSM